MNVLKKMGITIGELFFYLHFSLLLFAKGIGLYEGQALFTGIMIISALFFLMKLCVTKYTLRDIGSIVIIGGISALCFFISGEKGILFYACMMIGMKNMNIKRVFQVGGVVWAAAFAGTTIISFLSIPHTAFKVHAKLGLGHMFRWGLGYSHPNVLHISYLIFLIFLIYCLKQRFSLKLFLWMFLGNCLVFLYSVSYTGFAIVTFYLLGNYYWTCRGKFNRLEKILVECVMPGCIMVSLLAPVILSGKSFNILNKMLNTRLSLSKHFLVRENITLFGRSLQEITNQWMTMDSSYVYGLVAYGVLFFAGVFVLFGVLIHVLVSQQRGKEIWMILAVLAAGLTEPFMFNTSYKNIIFLFAGALIFGGRQSLLEEENAFRLPAIRITGKGMGKAFGISLGAGLIVAVIYGMTVKMPERVIVPRKECADIGKDSSVYLEPEDELWNENVWILGYQDAETPMEVFDGNLIKVEYFRGCVGSGFLAMSVVYLILAGKKQLNRKKEKRLYE